MPRGGSRPPSGTGRDGRHARYRPRPRRPIAITTWGRTTMYRDLREFIARLEADGRLHRVRREVDWDLELAHVAKINEQEGGPALLFENVKGYPGASVLTSLFTAKERVAMALELPPETRFLEIARSWVQRIKDKRIAPVQVPTGSCKDVIETGDGVDL